MERKQPRAERTREIILHPHPILPTAQRKTLLCEVLPGSTIREILAHSGIDIRQPIVVVLDDRLITVDEWDLICPKPGQMINVRACVSGGGDGGGGSNPVQMVALIAVIVISVYTFGAGSAFAAAYGTTASAIAVGVSMAAGSMIVNSVFAASNPATDNSLNGASGQYSQGSPTYSLSGGSNRMRPYESMPVVMGTHRFFPDLAARPYVEYQGDDQFLHQIFHLGLSRCDFSDWKIGTNPITNYQDYTWSYANSFGKISSFPGNVDSIAGADLVQSAGWITRTSSSNTYRIGIDLEGILYYANDKGGLDSTSVQIRVQYKLVGSATWIDPAYITTQGNGFVSGHYETYSAWVESGEEGYYTATAYDDFGNPYTYETWGWHDTSHYETRSRYVGGSGNVIIVSGASQSPRRATLFIDVPVGTYDVRLIRDTADSTDSRLQNKTSWSTLRSYQSDLSSYAGQNRIGLTIRASEQLNGAISQLSVVASGYANYWNGTTWINAKTSNPAHWFMYFAIGDRDPSGSLNFGVGLTPSQIDLDELHAWSLFCTREGLTWNAVLDGPQGCEDILNAIARCGFASPSRSSGRLSVIWDERNLPVTGSYGMSNIINGSFEVGYITEQLAEEIIVRYINPEKDWVQDEVRVTVPTITNPNRTSTIDLMGCTSQSMAGKFANYLAAQQYYRKRRIKWDCDFEGFVNRRGDVVLLAHDLTQWGYSGRVVAVDGNHITLDRDVPRNGATEYLMLKKPNGDLITYTVISASTDGNIVELSTAPEFQSGHDLVDHMWFFSPLPTPGKKVKILSVKPLSSSRLSIIATDEDPQFYAAWDGTWTAPSQNTLLTNNKPKIIDINVSERLVLINLGMVGSRVTISTSIKNTFEKVFIKYKIDGVWTKAETYTGYIEFDTHSTGKIEIEATAINGVTLGNTFIASAFIYGKSLPPSDIKNLGFETVGNSAYLTFDPPSDIDVQIGGNISVRFSGRTNGASWGSATGLCDAPALSNRLPIPLMSGTYLAKWVDSTGNESNNAALVINTIDSGLLSMNVVGLLNDGSLWGGSKNNLVLDSTLGGIKLDSILKIDEAGVIDEWYPIDNLGGLSQYGEYYLNSTINLGRTVTSRLGSSIDWNTYISSDTIDTRPLIDSLLDFDGQGDPFDIRLDSIDDWDDIDGNLIASADVWSEISHSSDGVNWSDWKRLFVGDYSFQYLKARIVCQTLLGYLNILIKNASISIDMPDRVESGVDIPSLASPTVVSYRTPFQAIPAVAITIQGMQAGDYYTLNSKTTSGFTATFKNAAGTTVSRTFDYIAKGY